jgi:Protein kinase domain
MERAKQQLGNYRLTRLMCAGAFADLYLGTHIYLNTEFAIKVPRGPIDAHARDSFLTEARLLINLVHPHIIRIIDCGVEADIPYLVMDYAPGGNVRQLHPAGSVVPQSTVIAYVSAIASALQYAHRQHVIHRDLKPENLLLGPTHELLVSDFGLALFVPDDDPVQVQERFGTLEYMAPEQILEASSLLAELLSACPELKIMVTSRVVLHLEGEQEFPVSPLALPDVQHLSSHETLAQIPAVALFVQRAQAAQPGFALSAENAAIVAELCMWLDGVPLTIVLASARIKLLSPEALLTRLQQHHFEVLTGRRLGAPVHQQTLRDTITWSYNLLSTEEQTIFRRLCVFVGGFTLEAAEAICTRAGDGTTPALEVISSLVDHRLLQLREQADGGRRLRLLEMIREYGLERLMEASELEHARDAHAAYYLELSERAEPDLYTGKQVQ